MVSHMPLAYDKARYSFIVGTGGIGSGLFFLLEGNQTMTRNESRLGRQLSCRDYCKQHIILHYVAVLLGAAAGSFEVYPIGMVGDDDRGLGLMAEMDSVGMDTQGVTATRDAPTLLSVCFQYPDSTGGNITTSNGASSLLTAGDIAAFLKANRLEGKGMALAVPEAPLEARIALLQEGRRRGWFNAASFSAIEAASFASLGGLALCDLISVNRDEAAALAGLDADTPHIADVVRGCNDLLVQKDYKAMMIITDGPRGCWACTDGKYVFTPPLLVGSPVSTAGAGDALFAGTIAGLACGLPFLKQASDGQFSETPLGSAIELGTLLASLSVTSADTIHWGADAALLREHAAAHGVPLSASLRALLMSAVS